jgi:hypothetical protein
VDDVRQIRFIYPPLLLATALAIALWIDPADNLHDIPERLYGQDPLGGVVSIALGSGVLLALGYVIGTIPIFVLRTYARIAGVPSYEAVLSPQYQAAARSKTGMTQEPHCPEALPYIAAALCHGELEGHLHSWIERRWNAMNLATHSATGLTVAWLIVHCGHIAAGSLWNAVVPVLVVTFVAMARYTWLDVRGMADLIAQRTERLTLPRESGHPR